jgi:hypothetical protein
MACILLIIKHWHKVSFELTFTFKGNELMKNLMNMLLFALVSIVTLPSFASTPQSAADCQKTHAGDKDKIQACITGLKK